MNMSRLTLNLNGWKKVINKNKEKEERKARRKPPIPFTRSTPTKKEKLNKLFNKHKGEKHDS